MARRLLSPALKFLHESAVTAAPLTLIRGQESYLILQDPNDKIQRSILKIAGWVLGIIIVLVAGGIFGHKAYRDWQERRLVAQANALINEGNLKRASLDARRIVQVNPDSVPGCRIMARLAEITGSKTAIEWRRRVVDLQPNSAPDMIALGRAAVRFNDKAALEFVLGKLPEGAKTTAEYHAFAAELALSRNDPAGMEEHLREAVRLDPANQDNLLRLATVQAASSDNATHELGKQVLADLQKEPAFRRDATRRLLIDALRRHNFEEAITLGRQLDTLPDKAFADRLLLLSAFHGSASPEFSSFVQELKNSAASDPEQAAELLSWFNGNGMPAAAIAWAAQLPPETMTQKGVPIALADSYIAAADWEGMRRVVKTGNWGSIDFLRNALATRAAREMNDEPVAAAEWAEAIKKVSANPAQALTLAEVVQKWGWMNETIELFWLASKDPANGDAALQALYNHFSKSGATQDLYRVLLHRQEFLPSDRNIQNNVAQLSLLLNLNVERARKIARDLYESEPKNPVYASSYAFALHTKGDDKQALKILNTLTPEQLRQPDLAAYYGIVLAATGDHARAAEYLDLAEKAGLLPEERALVEKARRTLARR